MVRTQVSFDEAMYEAAKAEAARRGISLAEFCRRAIQAALPPRDADQPWMALAGAVQSGDRNASSTVDDVVYNRETL